MSDMDFTEEDFAPTFSESDFQEQPQVNPPVSLSPYEQYRLSGGEPVRGPFGPAHPEEVLTIPQSLLQPPGPVLGERVPEPGEKGGLGQDIYESLVKPTVETALSPAGLLSMPLLEASAPLRLAAGAAFGALGAKEGLEQMGSPDPRQQMQGRLKLAVAPLVGISGGLKFAKEILPSSTKAAAESLIENEVQNAQAIRSDTGRPDETGQAQEGSPADSGGNLQQAASGPPNAPTQGEVGVTSEVPLSPSEEVKQLALKTQKQAGWDTKWPFVPADFLNKDFRLAIEKDPGIPPAEKDQMFSAAEKLLGGKIKREPPPSSALPGASPAAPAVSAAAEEGGAAPSTEPATAEPTVRTSTEQVGSAPQIKGMGGAIPEEFVPSSGSPTSIKNAQVDVERAKRGLPPAIQPARKSFGEVWDRAMSKIDQDPTYPDYLIDSLEQKPRALTDEEDATLLQRQVDLQNEYGKAVRDLAQAHEDGRVEAAATEKVRVAALSDQLLRLYNVGKKVGTETGRGLNARKMLANEDFTLAKMSLDLRAAKGGAQLTPEETIQVQKAHNAVTETQQRLDQYEGNKKATESTQQADQVINELTKARPPRKATGVKPPKEEIQSNTDSIRKKIAEGDMDISRFVRKLARAFVADGINDREALIDAVHSVLKQAIPEITRRETMDAISGYGEFKQLTKDAISVKLRGMKGEMQQLAKLEDMARGEPPLKTGIERRTPTDAERQLIKEVNDAKNKFQIPVQDPSTQLKSALDTLKTTLRNRIADYEDRLAKGDFAPRPRRAVVLDPEASRLKAENERVKKAFQRQVQIERLKNRTNLERTSDWITKWRRGFLLSGPNTLAKLTSAAIQRAVFTPTEEAIGGVVGKAIPGVSKAAPREGGFNVKAEAKAITQGLTKGMEDAWKTLRTGQSDLDVLYGKEALLPPSAVDFFGHVHGALKAPIKRAEFARSLEKRTTSALSQGVDITDPMVQSRLVIDSYKDANRTIFLQDNRVVNAYKRGLQALEQKDKATGEVPSSGKVASTAAKVLLPIVKVPTNIVAETMQYALGSVTGSARLARAYARGIESIKPEEADLIMRQLKKGSIGAATMLLGYFNPDVVGGYYQPGEKRKPTEPKATSIRLYGENIPSYLLHSPLLETLQIGATVRRVADAKINKKSPENKGIGEGIYAGALGLAEDVPFIRETLETAKAFNPREKGAFWGELGRSLLVPQALQWVATHTDPVEKRTPKTALEHVKMGIPILREQVKPKKESIFK